MNRKFKRRWVFAILLSGGVGSVAVAIAHPTFVDRLDRFLWRQTEGAWLGAARSERGVMIAAQDGVALATDIYRPLFHRDHLPTVLMRLPYGRADYREVHHYASRFVRRGYAVVVQDMRGRFDSGGEFALYQDDAQDAMATLDWIVQQPWSNQRVGTIGCSALGESQVILAKHRHPAHTAMIPIGAGGAIGSLRDNHNYFAFFEGGVLTLSSAFGWFARWGGKTGDRMDGPDMDYGIAVRELPVISLVDRVRDDPTEYEEFIRNFANDKVMRDWGFISDKDRFATPGLMIDTWYDTAVSASFQLSAHMRESAPDQHLIIAPGTHCQFHGVAGQVGEMTYGPEAARDYDALFFAYFDHLLKGGPAPDLAPYTYYMLGADRWMEAEHWPPEDSVSHVMPLSANTPGTQTGDILEPGMTPRRGMLRYMSDPNNPTPSIGGATCCTNDPDIIEGPAYQNIVENRSDVATFTSAEVTQPLRIAGPVTAVLNVSTNAPDADLVARISDVDPQGRSLMIQEGALRLRYRNGFSRPELMTPGIPVEASVSLRDIAYELKPGHRLRLTISSSSFPRLERNLQQGGDNHDESEARIAEIQIHTGSNLASRLELFTLPLD